VALSSAEAAAAVADALPGLGKRYRGVSGAEVKVSVIDGLDGVTLPRGPTHLGLGIRKEGKLIRVYLLLATVGR
jgi:hypothetical protein